MAEDDWLYRVHALNSLLDTSGKVRDRSLGPLDSLNSLLDTSIAVPYNHRGANNGSQFLAGYF